MAIKVVSFAGIYSNLKEEQTFTVGSFPPGQYTKIKLQYALKWTIVAVFHKAQNSNFTPLVFTIFHSS